MDNRKLTLFGTPLTKSIEESRSDNNDGPINSRKARLAKQQQQTVRDEQGRRRFHGAFTGGFSAGYFNTVDTVEGFRPKSFVTHRASKQYDRDPTRFEHKPEDYMDEEDLGEFGIAPRKIRVTSSYCNTDEPNWSRSKQLDVSASLAKLLCPRDESIGEKILRRSSRSRRRRIHMIELPQIQKNNFHGLGYKPLRAGLAVATEKSDTSSNPLVALLGEGRRLQISGEAFGSGVLDDDDDECPNHTEEYGYDDMKNYDFQGKSSQLAKTLKPTNDEPSVSDRNLLPGFILAKDLYQMKLCDSLGSEYSLPEIEANWEMPVRSEPCIAPPSSSTRTEEALNWHKSKQQVESLFSKRFATSSSKLKSESIGDKAGLLSYTDLKAVDPKELKKAAIGEDVSIKTKATLNRVVVDWQPCNLLCKHFNVPNPHPESTVIGLKPIDQIETQSSSSSADRHCERFKKVASFETRRSIFNFVFDESSSEDDDDDGENLDNVVQLEGAPKVLEVDLTQDCDSVETRGSDNTDQESDIVIVNVPKQELEVIVLSSSTSSRSPTPTPGVNYDRETEEGRRSHRSSGREGTTSGEDEFGLDDTYGPPLPPTQRKSLDSCDHHRSSVSRHRSSSSRAHKKHKRTSQNSWSGSNKLSREG